MPQTILIIGAGLGGLSLAQGLVKAGFNVKVFERDESSTCRAQGYRISLRTMGMNALKELLPLEKFNRLDQVKVAEVGDGFTCANEQMISFFAIPQGHDAATQLLRSELRSLLQEDIAIEWNKRFKSFEIHSDSIMAHFDDGTSAKGDLLVGCDGGASCVREYLSRVSPSDSLPKVIPNNKVIFGGQIDRTPEWKELLPLNNNGFVRYVGPNSHSLGVCFSERSDRTPTVFWALSEETTLPTPSDPQAILDYCKEVMRDEPWHPNLKKLVFDTSLDSLFLPWNTRTTLFSNSPHFPLSTSGRVTLVGDSAHSMSPDKGLGGNNVLEDARLLSSLLASSSQPLPALIKDYEEQMFTRARLAVEESNQAASLFRSLRP